VLPGTADSHSLNNFLWPDEAPRQAQLELPCPNCGDAAPKAILCLAAPQDLDRPWRLLACPGCGAGFYEDQTVPDYADEGMTTASTTYFIQQGSAVSFFGDILARLRKAAGARYVEIGCGFGFGLDIARHAFGWQARGMDPAALSKVGRRLLEVDIEDTYFDPSTVLDASCDVVMATEVLEHLPDPVGFLREIHRGLVPGGVAVLTTPDVAAVRPEIEKPVLQATLTVGSHLVLQSTASIERALHRAGFTHVRVLSDGWRLTAFASDTPLEFEEDPARRKAIILRYLLSRAEGRKEPDDLFIGFTGRAYVEAVNAQEWRVAARLWSRLDKGLRARYGLEIDDLVATPALDPTAPEEQVAKRLPFSLAAIMLARAYQRLAAGEPRSGLADRFAAIRPACAPLADWLVTHRIGDMQIHQILWVAEAEIVLCKAACGSMEAIRGIARLPESPTGQGRAVMIERTVDYFIHGARPFMAAVLARRVGLRFLRREGDLSPTEMARALVREVCNRIRKLGPG
jgi:SAM-dependent methyltransferase